MKNIILFLLSSVFMISSCSKDSSVPKTNVTFQFSDFNWEVGNFGKSTTTSEVGEPIGDTLSNYATYFYYRAYNSSGVKVSERTQTASEPDFGTVTDVLDPGAYTIVFTASRKPLGFSKYGLSGDHFYDMANGYWDDTFFQKTTVTVGSEPTSHNVRLERVVGALELTLLDAIPNNVSKISITVEYEHGVYQLATGIRSATGVKTKDFMLLAADKGQSNKKFLMHILNISRPQKITIKSYDANNVVINSKTVDNVNFYQNRKTLLRGNLSAGSQFNVAVDPVWGTPTAPIEF